MADMDTSITFTYNVVDNVTPTAERMAGAQDKATEATDRTNQSIDSQNIKFITQLAAVGAAYGGLRRMTSGMHELGLVSDADAAKLNKVVSVVGIVSGAFMTLRSAIKIMEGLRSIEISVAAVETYRSVLKNPAAMVGVGAGIAAAGAVAGREGVSTLRAAGIL
jgi:hypothetical protein